MSCSCNCGSLIYKILSSLVSLTGDKCNGAIFGTNDAALVGRTNLRKFVLHLKVISICFYVLSFKLDQSLNYLRRVYLIGCNLGFAFDFFYLHSYLLLSYSSQVNLVSAQNIILCSNICLVFIFPPFQYSRHFLYSSPAQVCYCFVIFASSIIFGQLVLIRNLSSLSSGLTIGMPIECFLLL